MDKLLEAVDQQASSAASTAAAEEQLDEALFQHLCQKFLYGIFIPWVRNSIWPMGEIRSWPLLGNIIIKWKTVSNGIFSFYCLGSVGSYL